MVLPAKKRLVLLAALLAGYGLLLVETRFEHRVVLGTKWQPLIPVVFSAVALTVGTLGLAFFRTFGRKILLCLFAASILVGCIGSWLHGKGELAARLGYLVTSLFGPVGRIDSSEMGIPPLLAPQAFTGLGVIGLLVVLDWRGKSNESGKEGDDGPDEINAEEGRRSQ